MQRNTARSGRIVGGNFKSFSASLGFTTHQFGMSVMRESLKSRKIIMYRARVLCYVQRRAAPHEHVLHAYIRCCCATALPISIERARATQRMRQRTQPHVCVCARRPAQAHSGRHPPRQSAITFSSIPHRTRTDRFQTREPVSTFCCVVGGCCAKTRQHKNKEY